MTKKLLVIWFTILLLLVGLYLWLQERNDKPVEELSPPAGVIREESLDIKTDNPQPAGQNIQPN